MARLNIEREDFLPSSADFGLGDFRKPAGMVTAEVDFAEDNTTPLSAIPDGIAAILMKTRLPA